MTTAAQPPSDTPRTDAAMCVLHPGVQPSVWYVQATVCREIERNLAAAQATIARQAEELERVRKDAGLAKQIARGIIGDKALDQGRLSMLRAVLVRIEALAAAEKEPAK